MNCRREDAAEYEVDSNHDEGVDDGAVGPPEWDEAISGAIARGAGNVAHIINSHVEARDVFTEFATMAKPLAEMASASSAADNGLQTWLRTHFRSTSRVPEQRTYTTWLRALEDTFLLRVVGWVVCEEDLLAKSAHLKTDVQALCGHLRGNSPSDSTAQQLHSHSC